MLPPIDTRFNTRFFLRWRWPGADGTLKKAIIRQHGALYKFRGSGYWRVSTIGYRQNNCPKASGDQLVITNSLLESGSP